MRSKSKGVRDDGGKSQAVAWMKSISEMVSALRKARDAEDNKAEDAAREAIENSALSVEVRDGWRVPGSRESMDLTDDPAEGCILLCTGGPAVRLIFDLEGGSASEVSVEYQDWGTPWTPLRHECVDNGDLCDFVSCFYFG